MFGPHGHCATNGALPRPHFGHCQPMWGAKGYSGVLCYHLFQPPY